jgi:DeoR/GlpR family transcriptional regulator of sugar metabolism
MTTKLYADQVLDLIPNPPLTISIDALINRTACHRSTVRSRLNELLGEGKILEINSGTMIPRTYQKVCTPKEIGES